MKKINKDLNDIPPSLSTNVYSLSKFPAKKTHQRRLEVINQKHYIDDTNHNNRYKYKDIRSRLDTTHCGKCAFCETSDQQLDVEHYRPKKGGYYWLAYSWDNLLLACTKCNRAKGNKFEIAGNQAVFNNTPIEIDNINTLSESYDREEQPWLINPEKVTTEELKSIRFNMNGEMYSENQRMQYTIAICQLSRDDLNQKRKKIWDDFVRKLKVRILKYSDNKDYLRNSIQDLIIDFKREASDNENVYIAFRNYVLNSDWIFQVCKDVKI